MLVVICYVVACYTIQYKNEYYYSGINHVIVVLCHVFIYYPVVASHNLSFCIDCVCTFAMLTIFVPYKLIVVRCFAVGTIISQFLIIVKLFAYHFIITIFIYLI